MRISDWSSDVCSSDLFHGRDFRCRSDAIGRQVIMEQVSASKAFGGVQGVYRHASASTGTDMTFSVYVPPHDEGAKLPVVWYLRSEEHTSELQSLMRISYAVFCLKKKKHHRTIIQDR